MNSLSDKPQKVLDTPNKYAIFMTWVFKTNDRKALRKAFAKACMMVQNLNNSANIRFPGDDCSVVLGVGYEAWSKLDLGDVRPREFRVFPGLYVTKHHAPGTPGDVHFHIRGNTSFNVDAAQALRDCLKEVADCTDTVQSWKYHDGRSILGFVDGTENPTEEARPFFALIGDEDPDFKYGSYLFVQKYIHDMDKWRSLSVEEQEKVIGRTKTDDIELDDETKPVNSHVAVTNVGSDHKVVRDNLNFGNPGTNDMGTYFICYARSFTSVQLMIRSMFIGVPPGNTDAILEFSTAKTGALYFVPSLGMLGDWCALE